MRPLVAYPVIYSGLVIMTTLFVGVSVQPFVKRVGRHADLLGLGAGAIAIALGAHAAAVASPVWSSWWPAWRGPGTVSS